MKQRVLGSEDIKANHYNAFLLSHHLSPGITNGTMANVI